MSTDHRTVLVTGASSGIGLATVRLLLEEGHRVIGLARRPAPIANSEDKLICHAIDLSRLDEFPGQLGAIARAHADIDAVICCAGAGRFGSLEEFSYQQIREQIDLNLVSTLLVARTFLPLMKRAGQGDLVFLGSESATSGARNGSVYCASKFGLRGAAQALREECATSAVRVCLVNPGMVRSAFFDELHFEPGEEPSNYIEPDDVARTIVHVLNMRGGTVVDEINLSPQKKVVRSKPKDQG